MSANPSLNPSPNPNQYADVEGVGAPTHVHAEATGGVSSDPKQGESSDPKPGVSGEPKSTSERLRRRGAEAPATRLERQRVRAVLSDLRRDRHSPEPEPEPQPEPQPQPQPLPQP